MTFRLLDCRIDAVATGSITTYWRATHLPTGVSVRQDGEESRDWPGRTRLVNKLKAEVMRRIEQVSSSAPRPSECRSPPEPAV